MAAGERVAVITFIVAMRSRYDLQVAMFSSSTSSDRSSMWDENRGSPFFAKYSCQYRDNAKGSKNGERANNT